MKKCLSLIAALSLLVLLSGCHHHPLHLEIGDDHHKDHGHDHKKHKDHHDDHD